MIETAVIAPVPALLTRHAHERPHQVAFRDQHKAVTYADLDRRTACLAGHLRDLGLEQGEQLLMYLDNCVEVAEGYLAAPRAGTVTACANPTATESELAYMLDNSDARIVLTDRAHLPVVAILAASRPRVSTIVLVGGTGGDATVLLEDGTRLVSYDDLVETTPRSRARDDTELDEWSWMLFTSGTTGRPKGVRLNQRGCLWVVAACWIPLAGLSTHDHLLSTLPLFHSYALVLAVVGVSAAGATATLLPKFSPTDVMARLTNDKVTVFPGVPTMFKYLLNTHGETCTLEAPDLRLCISAGAIMSAALNEEFERFIGVPLVDGYGITETSTMITMNTPNGGRVPGSCGLPLPGVSIRLVDTHGVDVFPGDEGELWVQGPNLMLGYHEMPEATAAALAGGWYHTGDLARRDANGFVTISGRVKELIIRAGENISPAEIEEVVQTCASVDDVAVIGVPHPDLGEVPVACVSPVAGRSLDRADILSACQERLSYFKIPADIVEVQQIPRTGSGKIQRFQLQKILAAQGIEEDSLATTVVPTD